MVVGPVARTVGFCSVDGTGWTRFLAKFPRYEERLRERDLSLCRYGVPEGVRMRAIGG